MKSEESAHSESLIEREAAQLPLLEVPPDAVDLSALEAKGEFTGERLMARDPGKYRAIVRALAEHMPVKSIAQAFGVSEHTVRGIRSREVAPIAADKKEIAQTMREVVALGLDRLRETFHEIAPKDLAVTIGILTDKSLVLDGEANMIVGSSADRIKVEAFNELVASLPLQMGFPAGEKMPNGEALALPAEGSGLVIEVPDLGTGTDRESVVSDSEGPK